LVDACRYELLDEAMDFGFPQLTDPTVLKSLITQKGWRGDLTELGLEMLQKVPGSCMMYADRWLAIST
jgi:hypothetical protein